MVTRFCCRLVRAGRLSLGWAEAEEVGWEEAQGREEGEKVVEQAL
jgi:hypothetical protein